MGKKCNDIIFVQRMQDKMFFIYFSCTVCSVKIFFLQKSVVLGFPKLHFFLDYNPQWAVRFFFHRWCCLLQKLQLSQWWKNWHLVDKGEKHMWDWNKSGSNGLRFSELWPWSNISFTKKFILKIITCFWFHCALCHV